MIRSKRQCILKSGFVHLSRRTSFDFFLKSFFIPTLSPLLASQVQCSVSNGLELYSDPRSQVITRFFMVFLWCVAMIFCISQPTSDRIQCLQSASVSIYLYGLQALRRYNHRDWQAAFLHNCHVYPADGPNCLFWIKR